MDPRRTQTVSKSYETKCDGTAAGTLTSRPMFKLASLHRRGGPVSRVRQIRNGCDACTRPPRRVPAAQYTIVSSSFAPCAFLRHRPLLFPATPRSSCLLLSAQVTERNKKGHRFSHSKKRERFRSSRPDNAEYDTR